MDLFKCTAAVAIWGNSKWKQRPREEQAEPDGTEEVNKVAALFGIDEADLLKGLTKPRIKVLLLNKHFNSKRFYINFKLTRSAMNSSTKVKTKTKSQIQLVP